MGSSWEIDQRLQGKFFIGFPAVGWWSAVKK